MKRSCWRLIVAALVWAGGCATPTDYGAFLAHMPRSILVIPPLNHSAEAMASDAFLSTVTQPLAESGYYVFPVALVDRMMKENGLPTPGEMHQVPINKFKEVFGADAVLYVQVRQWNQQYVVIGSKTTVTLEYRLVDLETGTVLWQHIQTASAGQGGLGVQGLIEAALHAVVSAATNEAKQLSNQANTMALQNPDHGLLKGHRYPEYEKDQKTHRAQQKKLEQKAKP